MFSALKNNRLPMSRVCSLVFVSICVATICLTATASVHAVTIFSVSFEEGGGTGYVALPDNNGLSIHGLNGWVKNDVNFNSVLYYDPITFDVRLPGTTGDNIQGPLPHGGQALYTVSGASATNTLGTTTVAGTTYTLSVRIGDSANDATAANADLTLLFGGLPVATATGSPPINPDSIGSNSFAYAFGTLTTSFVALTSGQSIAIKLDNLGPAGNIIYFDAVELDAEAAAAAVPEPSTFVLAALGLAGLGLVAWRRRK